MHESTVLPAQPDAEGTDLPRQCEELGRRARDAGRTLAARGGALKDDFLKQVAVSLLDREGEILEANSRDLEQARTTGLGGASLDRLRLDRSRLEAAAAGLREVAALPDPIGRIIDSSVRPNGLLVQKVGVPLGVIFFIYESRPNVTVDAAGLCVKSGNAIVLRGGKEAVYSNTALVRLLRDCLERAGLPADAVQMVPTADRAAVGHLLQMDRYIDLVIPRGGKV